MKGQERSNLVEIKGKGKRKKKLLGQKRMEGGNQFVKTKEIKEVRKFLDVKETERSKHDINKK